MIKSQLIINILLPRPRDSKNDKPQVHWTSDSIQSLSSDLGKLHH